MDLQVLCKYLLFNFWEGFSSSDAAMSSNIPSLMPSTSLEVRTTGTSLAAVGDISFDSDVGDNSSAVRSDSFLDENTIKLLIKKPCLRNCAKGSFDFVVLDRMTEQKRRIFLTQKRLQMSTRKKQMVKGKGYFFYVSNNCDILKSFLVDSRRVGPSEFCHESTKALFIECRNLNGLPQGCRGCIVAFQEETYTNKIAPWQLAVVHHLDAYTDCISLQIVLHKRSNNEDWDMKWQVYSFQSIKSFIFLNQIFGDWPVNCCKNVDHYINNIDKKYQCSPKHPDWVPKQSRLCQAPEGYKIPRRVVNTPQNVQAILHPTKKKRTYPSVSNDSIPAWARPGRCNMSHLDILTVTIQDSLSRLFVHIKNKIAVPFLNTPGKFINIPVHRLESLIMEKSGALDKDAWDHYLLTLVSDVNVIESFVYFDEQQEKNGVRFMLQGTNGDLAEKPKVISCEKKRYNDCGDSIMLSIFIRDRRLHPRTVTVEDISLLNAAYGVVGYGNRVVAHNVGFNLYLGHRCVGNRMIPSPIQGPNESHLGQYYRQGNQPQFVAQAEKF